MKGTTRRTHYEWVEALGHCGYNLPVGTKVFVHTDGLRKLFSWFINGHATCTVVGLMTCGGDTIEDAQQSALAHMRTSSREDYDRYMSDEEFSRIIKQSEG